MWSTVPVRRWGDAPTVEAILNFDDFFRAEYRKAVLLAYAVSGSRAAAEDIAQEAMLEAHRWWDRICRYDKPGAWLRRVTIQKASRRLRRRRSEAAAIDQMGAVQLIPKGPGEVEAVFEALRSLPTRQRAAISLYYLDGYSVADTALALGCAEGTVKAHLHKGRRALARILGEGFEE
jgi:RNA polymerase sigma-70 factor, ECF subfamily